ncbi:MAG: GatB/YqeY domain-containing protein [bacterium]|nr:GatB/YqeY domain-containing protein [bacterium]
MSLKERINEDLKTSFKNGSIGIVSTLRFLSSVIKNKELEKRTKLSKGGEPAEELEKLSELTDEELTNVVLGEIKKRKESIAQYEKGGRVDLAKKEDAELQILKKYVPEEMSEEELRAVIKKKIGEMDSVTIKDFGRLISSVMAEVKGRAGGDIVKKIIEEELK